MTEEETRAAEKEAAEQGAKGLVEISRSTWDVQVMDPTKDVVVLLYSSADTRTKELWPYWKKTVERFRALGVASLRLGRFDVSRNQLPGEMEVESLPSIAIFPAKDKEPPYKLYHGKGKVRPIMLWVQKLASIPIVFPNDTPHLDDEQRKAYLVQVKDRDEKVGKRRAEARAVRMARLREEDGGGDDDHDEL